MSGENAQQGPAGMVEPQGLSDSWVMRALSSAGKEKIVSKDIPFPTLLKSTLYCFEVSAKADDVS